MGLVYLHGFFMVNVGKYTIHGCYGLRKPPTQENSTATLIGYIYEIYADFFEENLLSFENSPWGFQFLNPTCFLPSYEPSKWASNLTKHPDKMLEVWMQKRSYKSIEP